MLNTCILACNLEPLVEVGRVAVNEGTHLATTNGVSMVEATNATWLEMPEPKTVKAACRRLSLDCPGQTIAMTWYNDAVMCVFVVGEEDYEE